MTNEIKEILKRFNEFLKGGNYTVLIMNLTKNEVKTLLNYITNLQEENKEWEMIFDTFSRRPYAHRYLEEKRKELNNNKIIGLDSESIYKDYYNLIQRIDKAIKKIEKDAELIDLEDGYNTCMAVIDILRGDE